MPPPRFVAHALSPSLRIDVGRARSRHALPAQRRTEPVCLTVCGRPPAIRANGLALRLVSYGRAGQARAEPNRRGRTGLAPVRSPVKRRSGSDASALNPKAGFRIKSNETSVFRLQPAGSRSRWSQPAQPMRTATRSKANQPGVGPRHRLRPCPILLLLCTAILFLL